MSIFLLGRRGLIASLASLGAAIVVTACNDTGSDFNPNAAPRARAPGVPVALVSLEGAPEGVISRLSVSLAKQATRRDILIVGVDGKPRYQVRGYVTLQASMEGRGNLIWTFDLFDAQRKRARRVSGSQTISTSTSGENWPAISDVDLERVAFYALDDIAEFLAATAAPLVSQTPQARTVSLQASEVGLRSPRP
jgi:hypothetical protein